MILASQSLPELRPAPKSSNNNIMMILSREETPQQVLRKVCDHYGFEPSTPLSHLSVEQQFMLVWAARNGMPQQEAKEYLFGLKGIETEFGVSHKCAQAWKNSWLAPAIEQTGKVILCDKAMAHELFKQRKEGRK